MHLLAIARTDNSYQKLLECTVKSEFEFDLISDLDIIQPLIDMMQQVAVGQGALDSKTQVQVGVALENALTNAMFRGNLEMGRDAFPVISPAAIVQHLSTQTCPDRKVSIRALITPQSVEFTIGDQGPGFDTATVPEVTDPESYRDGVGRGLVLIQALMDKVEFNANGNRIFMAKYRK